MPTLFGLTKIAMELADLGPDYKAATDKKPIEITHF
jgi:hypothetical protein